MGEMARPEARELAPSKERCKNVLSVAANSA